MAGAFLFSVTVLAGIPEFTAKADEISIDRPDRIVYEGDVLEKAGLVYFVKPGMTEQVMEEAWKGDESDDDKLRLCLLHEDTNVDMVISWSPTDYRVPAPENGSNSYIIRIQAHRRRYRFMWSRHG